jgi:predicted O-linked N-acetylglucosamine transferase (SPINDLY family)
MTASPFSPDALLEEGLALHNAGRLEQARALYRQVVAADPANAQALELLGTLECQSGRFNDGLLYLEQSLALKPDRPDVLYNRGLALQYLKCFEEAVASFDGVVAMRPDYAQAWFARGNALQNLKRFEGAVASYDRALALRPDQAEVHSNRAYALHSLNRLEEAVAGYRTALKLRPDLAEPHIHLGSAWHSLGRSAEADASYADAVAIFDAALRHNPNQADLWFHRGNALSALKQVDAALDSYDRAVKLRPGHAGANSNRGSLLQERGWLDEALAAYGRAIAADPDFVDARNNRGNALQIMGRLSEARDDFDAVLAVNPRFLWLPGQALHTRMLLADWRDFAARRDAVVAGIRDGERISPPFPVQPMIDAPDIHRRAAEIYARTLFPESLSAGGIVASAGPRTRIAYFSSDFSNHPVSHLLAGLLARHDRARFEVFAFSLATTPPDEWTARIRAGVDHFIDVSGLSDLDIAARARTEAIDIAIDLNGFTKGHRAGAFAARAAPVQVNYLGYLGTMGVPYIDYILADDTIIPESHHGFYTEKVVALPCFQVNDDQQAIADKVFTRAELGLPGTGFVFCSFNQLFKLTPEMFDGWMRILAQVPGSVLWLFVTDETARANLRDEAGARGIAPQRLVFAGRMPLDSHLARLKQADVFLDSHPYNAGATASNALRVGLPVLTRIGQSFPARMGASLLEAVGLPELIADTPDAYEALAIRLATHPDEFEAIKRKLAANLAGSLLFDTERAARSLEAAFTAMVERARAGLPPEAIKV